MPAAGQQDSRWHTVHLWFPQSVVVCGSFGIDILCHSCVLARPVWFASPVCLLFCLCWFQVREAYQAKGWVLNNVQNIEQCKDDGYLQMINEQQGEGCHMWGHLSVSISAASKQVVHTASHASWDSDVCFAYNACMMFACAYVAGFGTV
jgi:hypothetical protein